MPARSSWRSREPAGLDFRKTQPLEPVWNYYGFCNNAVQRASVTVA
jgi:hypothetical protein